MVMHKVFLNTLKFLILIQVYFRSMNAMNKLISKKIFIKHKITTPKYEVIKKKTIILKILKKL